MRRPSLFTFMANIYLWLHTDNRALPVHQSRFSQHNKLLPRELPSPPSECLSFLRILRGEASGDQLLIHPDRLKLQSACREIEFKGNHRLSRHFLLLFSCNAITGHVCVWEYPLLTKLSQCIISPVKRVNRANRSVNTPSLKRFLMTSVKAHYCHGDRGKRWLNPRVGVASESPHHTVLVLGCVAICWMKLVTPNATFEYYLYILVRIKVTFHLWRCNTRCVFPLYQREK